MQPKLIKLLALIGISALALGTFTYWYTKKKQLKRYTTDPIVMGCTLQLSQADAPLGGQVKAGIELFVTNLNRSGGINGRPIHVVFMDDEYIPAKARANVENFIKTYKSPLLLCPTGSPTLQAYKELIEQKKLFVFFPATGSPLFRNPELSSIVHWRTSYYNEGRILTQYALEQRQAKSFALFYQNDAYGIGALRGARQALQQGNIGEYNEVPYATNATDFASAMSRLKNTDPQAVGFFSTGNAVQELIRQMGVEFFTDKYLFALSDLSQPYVKRFMAQKGLKLTTAEFVPNPSTSQLPIVQEYRELLAAQGKAASANTFMLEGYIAASLTAHILKQVTDPYNINSILSVIQRIKQTPFKGLMLDFNPQTHELVHKMWMDIGEPEWLEFNTD